jgi:hypothetical protein
MIRIDGTNATKMREWSHSIRLKEEKALAIICVSRRIR